LEGFSEDVCGVDFGAYSPNSHVIVDIVLSYRVMTEIYRPRVFRHGGLSSDMFRGLIVGVEMIVRSVIAEEPHYCTDMFACLITPGQGNIFAGGGCRDDELLRSSAPVKKEAIQV
jgi:hypothetical protein